MALGAFLRRDLTVSARRGTAFADRAAVVVVVAVVVAACALVWGWQGWDRSSIAGAALFALAAFGWVAMALMVLVMGLVPALVAPAIATERDRKTLDSLLATRLSATEIVLGTMGAGLLRAGNGLAALVPVFTLLAFLGGIDPRLIVLAVLGLASTAIALAALSVAASASARTASQASLYAVGPLLAWMCLPGLVVMLLPRIWPTAAPWVTPVAVRVLDSTPLGLIMSVSGIAPRGPLVPSVLRMIALQTIASVGFVLWAIVRLRPASRAAYDVENRAAILRVLRARWQPRPPCGDDPVLWHEMHAGRNVSPAALWVGRLIAALWIGLLAYVTTWFALPALGELLRSGYGATPGTSTVLEFNPFARVIAEKFLGLSNGPAPGQARLELNFVLRMATAVFDVLYVIMVAGVAAESVAKERQRDTWPGLIATPLTGREILRAKLLGSIWKSRDLAVLMLVLWIVGLLAGAVHPLGFLAALLGMGVSCGFLAALGVSVSLRSRDGAQATSRTLGPVMLCVSLGALPFILPGKWTAVVAGGLMPLQNWAALVSYEDVHAAVRGRAVPGLVAIGVQDAMGARLLLASWLISTTAQLVGAILLMRSAVRRFDTAVGRPVRSAPPAG